MATSSELQEISIEKYLANLDVLWSKLILLQHQSLTVPNKIDQILGQHFDGVKLKETSVRFMLLIADSCTYNSAKHYAVMQITEDPKIEDANNFFQKAAALKIKLMQNSDEQLGIVKDDLISLLTDPFITYTPII